MAFSYLGLIHFERPECQLGILVFPCLKYLSTVQGSWALSKSIWYWPISFLARSTSNDMLGISLFSWRGNGAWYSCRSEPISHCQKPPTESCFSVSHSAGFKAVLYCERFIDPIVWGVPRRYVDLSAEPLSRGREVKIILLSFSDIHSIRRKIRKGTTLRLGRIWFRYATREHRTLPVNGAIYFT